MSMNIHIFASRPVTFVAQGRVKSSIQTESFDAFQTDTNSTYKIMDAADKAQAYIDWCMQFSQPEQWPIFADDDIWGEREPIGYTTFDPYADHVANFKKWVAAVEDDGFTVKFEVV